MSYFVGIPKSPVLHRQISSVSSRTPATLSAEETASSAASSHDADEAAQDNRDVLVQRLNDLAQLLLFDESLGDNVVSRLHHGVDLLEREVQAAQHAEPSAQSPRLRRRPDTPDQREEDILWSSPLSPRRSGFMRIPPPPRPPLSRDRLESKSEMAAVQARLVTERAQELCKKLKRTVQELQERREETSHIHDLLVTRAEKAAQRILELEEHVKRFDEELESNQSELTYLRLQLHALEVQFQQFVPEGYSDDLSESIKNWKLDWADVDQRTKERRRDCRVAVELDDFDETTLEIP